MRRRSLPLGLALLAYALAFAQRAGDLVADTKVDLHVDPVGFLADGAAAWAPSGGLGQVQAGQHAGYLWPMGSFHALGDLVGLAPWLTYRLWLGTLLALAAWGAVRLLDELAERPRGVPHAVAGVLLIANPYVVTFANRTSVTLLAYALLPWLLLCVHRGLRDPRGWWWPAALALLVTSLGGGVNAAVASFVLLGPALLVAYEVGWGGVATRDAARFLVRAGPLALLASAWWIAPVLVQIRFGTDFLPFTEPAGAIWTSTSMSESLRLLGFWVSYLGLGYGAELTPAFDSSPTMLFAPLTVVATFAVPGLALAGFAWSRRWRYGPFFLGLALVALLVMFTGFPEDAPLRRALHFSYERVELVRFLRTAYKAGPLLALALACLGGVAAGALWQRLRGRAAATAAVGLAGAALVAASAWPLVAGRAVDDRIAFDGVPADWRAAAADLDAELEPGARAVVLPGQVFPYYRWGATQDAILPALSERPVAVRGVVPYADLRAVDLLWAIDSLVQQRRTLPGQLRPLLDLVGAGEVVTARDDDPGLSGAVDPHAAAEQLRVGAGLARPDRSYGAVRRYVLPDAPGLVRVLPLEAPLVVDGAASGLAALAALDALPSDRVVRYAADMTPGELRRAAAAGAEIVVSDSNRRRVVLPSQPRQSEGPTLAAGDPIPEDGAVLNPFLERGVAAQTVATLTGARSIRAPSSPSFVQFPEHRPYAAFDGDPQTWWTADRYLDVGDRWIEIDLGRPVDLPVLGLLPQRETATEVREIEVAGRRFAVEPGWNALPVGLDGVERVRIEITEVEGPPPGRTRGAGAIAEVGIPGVAVRERLRPPALVSSALARERAAGARHASLSFVFERTTGHDPFHRDPSPDPDATSVPERDNQSGALVAAAGDGELEIARSFELPLRRSWRADGWVSVAPGRAREAIARYARPDGVLGVPCGAVRVVLRAERPAPVRRVLRLRPRGTVADLRRSRPLPAFSCGRAVTLRPGAVTLRSPAGILRADLLRLHASAPDPLPAVSPPGRVLDPGDDGRSVRDGVEVELERAAWLVLAESYNRGWDAECDGRDLGEPRPVDGFANGWHAPADCREVRFAFGPQRLMDAGYAISGAACAGLLVLLALGRRRRRAGRGRSAAVPGQLARAAPLTWRPGVPVRPVPLRVALAAGVAAGVAGGLLFALRAGVVIGPAVALALWRGVGPATLAAVAGGLVAVVLPAIHLAFPPRDPGGFNSDYANDVLGAHWVAVAAWVLLALALSRAIPRPRAGARRGEGAG